MSVQMFSFLFHSLYLRVRPAEGLVVVYVVRKIVGARNDYSNSEFG